MTAVSQYTFWCLDFFSFQPIQRSLSFVFSTDPYKWGKIFSSCVPNETKLHSPIDLGDGAVKTDSVLELHGFGNPRASWTVANIRDTVVVEFATGMAISGDWLQHKYRLVEMRFHWGSKTTNGSEHTLNKRRFPMEMQFVGVAPGFVDVEAASHHQAGLAMMGVFIDVTSRSCSPVIFYTFTVKTDFLTVFFTPAALFMPGRDSRFYRYQGGQTTPPCLQNVEWIVFEKPILISSDQLFSNTASLKQLKPSLCVFSYKLHPYECC
uniref:Alpha-carbonic anhydrase domain-containing protein n=1 Tax=Pygocentrus nattereri TaxID=42514 RepID=A0A3B4DWC1_PYGNA